ncbi:dihydropteroate synthase [Shewanella surugensis]|uniref:Dihydropteroate synthase n=1 Tax=Shewanella surugensis TaxID=212020 RepID=A0ABT0LAL1_9GAMM|nr:dihydropteroate synthase [Shewanella surugensis]MCL1124717.1 dihydropteroate synthase [Shewanella surugensis]
MFELKNKQKILSLTSPLVMGIVNVTPDSFSDGGAYSQFDNACQQADKLITEGASIIDIGGESTRPGADVVSAQEELARVIPLIEYISRKYKSVWISIDTSKPEVMERAVAAGADLINDVRGLQAPNALEMAASLQIPVCLMHMQGEPKNMQASPQYQDVIQAVKDFFQQRIQACIEAGIKREHIILDPGFGFGKSLGHNFELLGRLSEFNVFQLPLLIGLSRKSMFGHLLDRDVSQRLPASLAGNILAVQAGAHILRVHDVLETQDVLKVLNETKRFEVLE